MTGLSLALANFKPGTGKTTSAVWLAHVFAQAGNSLLLVDADPSGSAVEWSDLAAMYPRLAPAQAAFPFRIVALPSRELHRRLPEIARDDDVVIIDTPQIEDHAAIARSALRYADEIVIPCAAVVACAQCGAGLETGARFCVDWGAWLGECPPWRATWVLAGIGGSQQGWPLRDVR